jgi:hypothetical protein
MNSIQKSANVEILVPTYLEAGNFDFSRMNTNITQNLNSLPTNYTNSDKVFNMNTNIITHMGHQTFKHIGYDSNIDILRKNGVKVINNVYQKVYKGNIKPTGFGDFIRGCYFLLQFCNKNNFEPKVFIYNSIAEFLINHGKNYDLYQKSNKTFSSNITMFVKNNWNDCVLDTNNNIVGFNKNTVVYHEFVKYMCYDVSVFSNNIFIYNIMFPEDQEITPGDKKYIRQMLEPTDEMSKYVDDTLKYLRLYKKKYNVIHIRSGDKYLRENSKVFSSNYIKKIVAELFLIFNKDKTNHDYLLLADNNEIKCFLMEKFPYLKSLRLNIIHIGEGSVSERQKVKNTLLDFYLLANSDSIKSFTAYPHGSGFSYWCAKTYNIPYSCKYITV